MECNDYNNDTECKKHWEWDPLKAKLIYPCEWFENKCIPYYKI
jgi:hypothetical protein